MKKKLMFFIALVCVVSFFSCTPEEQPDPDQGNGEDSTVVTQTPAVKISGDGNIEIASEGGTYNIEYVLTGEAEGGKISASCSADWITDIDSRTEGTVSFTASPNDIGLKRESYITVSYSYDGKTVKDSARIVQTCAPAVYDYDFKLYSFVGTWNGNIYGLNGEDNYTITLTDYPEVDLYTSTYYSFDIYSDPPLDEENPMPRTGTYTLGESGATEKMTFTPDFSDAISYRGVNGDEPIVNFFVSFKDGTLVISTEDGITYVFEAILTDQHGKIHHIIYEGNTVCTPNLPMDETPVIKENLQIQTKYATASYNGEGSSDGIMKVAMSFTDMSINSDGEVVPPGTQLDIEAYMPIDKNGKIATGKYNVSNTPGDNFTIREGELTNFAGLYILYSGTCAFHYENNESVLYGAIVSGTMTVEESGDGYNIQCDFTTEEGYNISCTYSGELFVFGVPGVYSSLTEDKTLDFSNIEPVAFYYGDLYGTGGSYWSIALTPPVYGEGLQIYLISESSDFEEGINSGTYTAGEGGKAYPGEFFTGYMEYGTIYGTSYLNMYMGGVYEFANATDGELNITNKGDGVYEISFSFTDINGYIFDGEWSGCIYEYDSLSGHPQYSGPQRQAHSSDQYSYFPEPPQK